MRFRKIPFFRHFINDFKHYYTFTINSFVHSPKFAIQFPLDINVKSCYYNKHALICFDQDDAKCVIITEKPILQKILSKYGIIHSHSHCYIIYSHDPNYNKVKMLLMGVSLSQVYKLSDKPHTA